MKTTELIQALRGTTSRSKRKLLDEAADKLEELSTAAVAPVRHGRWEPLEGD